MTRRRDDGTTFWNGGSQFNTSGQRLNEIDLDTPRVGRTIDEMTEEDWRQARATLAAVDAGQQ